MIRRAFPRGDIRWLCLLCGLLLLPWVMPEFRPRIPTDSYRSGVQGKKALYRIFQGIGEYEVSRNLNSFEVLLDSLRGSESEVALLILGPTRPPTEREWNLLLEFVRAGGSLVYAVADDAEEFRARAFDIEFAPLDEPIHLAETPEADFTTDLGELDGQYSWSTRGRWRDNNGQPVVTINERRQAVIVPAGRGTALFVATDDPFENYTLTWPDNAVLAMRMIETLGPRSRIIFDERLNTSGVPKVVAILLEAPLRGLSLHLLAGLCLFGWWRSRRFGPISPPHAPARSDLVSHADAVGTWHYRSHNGRSVLKLYLEQLRVNLGLRSLKGMRERRILTPIARRLGQSADDVIIILREALIAAKQEDLGRASAAEYIERLAKIRRAARRGD